MHGAEKLNDVDDDDDDNDDGDDKTVTMVAQ